ncbi:penicillin-binding protein 2 [Seongchinamella unica]|uniref:Peptidoglycan D,D-transpeptidase FtsI n=1 Tax=Seongchinamella unica TaxID=2547392 RepID=A0A4R5LUK2_9GAMM|nr:penicillin-binding transpeptidase domain-containing protein [Seongchinamella unica]TDG15084.1 penicillin-binding protein 2 [Seongchinamella unica]
MRSVARKQSPRKAALWRLYLVIGLLLSMLSLLVGRVLSLQILDTERGYAFLQNQGEARSLRTAEIPAYRGVITDRRGEPLAVSTPVVSIWADPQRLAGSERLPELAESLGMPLAELQRKLERYDGKRFMYLQRHRVPHEAREILARRFPGVYGEREYRRFYPAGEVAAQLVGFTNVDDEGIAGIELAYDDWLQGRPGKKKYIKDLRGNMVRDIGVVQPAAPGRDLRLSIDLRLQHLQHRELRKAVTAAQAESGSVVTLDARTGEVLAMVNYPVYNPNSRKNMKAASMRNRAITDTYEPGSTMKSMTLVAALESGRYTTSTLIDTAPGWIRVGPKTYKDPRNYGEVTLSRAIEKSSQVGVTKLAVDLGHEPIREVFQRFGIGEPMGTGFPGESSGLLPNRPRWYSTEKISLAFGYGITTTPLQLARAYTAFATGGLQRPVSLLALDGNVPEPQRVISESVASQVLDVLHAVTGEHGTARKARVDGFNVAGKTGTVRKVGPGGYIEDSHVALFAGLAPVNNPRVVTVVVINDPKGEDYGGGAVAAPVFSTVTRGALRLLGATPSEFPEEVAASAGLTGGAA